MSELSSIAKREEGRGKKEGRGVSSIDVSITSIISSIDQVQIQIQIQIQGSLLLYATVTCWNPYRTVL